MAAPWPTWSSAWRPSTTRRRPASRWRWDSRCAGRSNTCHSKRDLDGTPLNLVHRDVTPANVLVASSGAVSLLDFGVAAAANAAETQSMVVGKAPFMSPEQASGAEASADWDLYALGLVLYRVATMGKSRREPSPWGTGRGPDGRRATLVAPSTTNAAIPPELDDAILARGRRGPGAPHHLAGNLRTLLLAAQAKLPPSIFVPRCSACSARNSSETRSRSTPC